MVNACRGLFAATLWLAIALYPGGAFAIYVCTTVDLPGATYTSLSGINNVGEAAAGAIIAGNSYGLVYLPQSGQWNPLPVPPAGFDVGAYGINDFGFIAGIAVPSGAGTPEQRF